MRRERTNTPLQALVTLNDPQFVEAARRLAETTLKQGGEKTDSRIDFTARRLLARPLRPQEMQIVQSSLDALLKHYKADPGRGEEPLGGRPVAGRPEARSAHARRMDDAHERTDEFG